MIDFVDDFIKELPSILIFGVVLALSALIAVFIPSVIYKFCSICKSSFIEVQYQTLNFTVKHSEHNESDLSPAPSSTSLATATGIPRQSKSRRKRNALKRLYSNIVHDDSSTSDENNGGSSTPSSSRKKRRHSTAGPFHFARKAKE